MAEDLEALLQLASEPLGNPIERLPEKIRRVAGDLADPLETLLRTKNGFFAFERALHLFPLGKQTQGYDLERWNSQELWRNHYSDLLMDGLCFAEDIFGEQFLIREGQIWRFDPETGEQEEHAADLNEWAYKILDDDQVEVGSLFANDWEYLQGPLDPEKRLIPRQLFVFGGDFDLENLVALDAVKGMQVRAEVAQQIRDLPDGSRVEVEFTEDAG